MHLELRDSVCESAAIVSATFPTVLSQSLSQILSQLLITITSSIATCRRKSGLQSWDGNGRPVKVFAQLLRQGALASEARHELHRLL